MILGDSGKQWLKDLSEVIQLLEQKWKIRLGKSLNGGTEAFVTEVVTKNGARAILKIAMPQVEGNTVFEQEVEALTIANGDGYVRLLNYDSTHRAVLLEKLGSPLKDIDYPKDTQMEIICKTLKKSWNKPLPDVHNLQSSEEIINWFSNFIPKFWTELESPCSRQLVNQALISLESRLSNSSLEKSVLVHGDAHSGNILQDITKSEGSFKFIDPDGLIAEPAYDLGVLMREWLDDLTTHPLETGRKRCLFLSELTGVDAQAIWEWGLIQSVSTGLLLIKIGQKELGLQMLEVAEVWSEV